MNQAQLKNTQKNISAEEIAAEYQDFAYIVSHDLNAPLRHVKQFTQLIIDERPSEATKDEVEYIAHLQNALQKLEAMQSALLSFSRINTRDFERKETDCQALVENIVQSFKDKTDEDFTAKINTLPRTIADPDQLHTVFYALIDNALKFHKSGGRKTIEISARDETENYVFEIHDNGIGIAPQFHKEIFRMFRQLMPDDYPGTGAGLTLAQKIINRLGGVMSVASEPAKGTTIFFTLPKD